MEQGGSSGLGREVPYAINCPGRTLLLTVEEEMPSPAASFSSGRNYPPRVVTWKWGESGACPTLSSAGCCLPHCAGTKLQEGLQSRFQGAEVTLARTWDL